MSLRFFRSIYEGLKIALSSIRTNKVRSGLTTFGIIIGIVAVTTMSTTIDGLDRGFERSLDMLGRNVIYVQKWPWGLGGEYKWWEYINRRKMKLEYVDEIDQSSRYASAVSAATSRRASVRFKDEVANEVEFQGATFGFLQTGSMDIEEGRFFTQSEAQNGNHVAILGASVANALFDREYPLGKEVRISGQRFYVIGVLEKQGKFLGLEDFDNRVIVPIKAFGHIYGLRNDLQIAVKFPSEEAKEQGEYEIEGIMRRIRKIDPREENDFAINKPEAFKQQYDTMTSAIYGIGIFLTGLSLFVGGIGVMNIMFVSVRERTKEIGIRMAVGAKRWEIMLQFLIEAVIICIIGGLVGVGLSMVTTKIINQFFVAYMDWGTVIKAFVICSFTGVLFGFIPAYRASKSDPVESLRFE